ncbi:hypothetical protein G6F23_012959 [Rhizopus arrhizus]|nr:hypothetical protein G6F23_012959 [Rhizopus arrhizus]
MISVHPEALKRHTIASCHQEEPVKQHWERIESYYVSRLDTLQREIEQSTTENQKLSQSRHELLKEVVRLSQKSTELSLKNEALTRIIAEKENKIAAFMYEGVTLTDPPNVQPVRPSKSEGEIRSKKEPSLFRQISLRLSSSRKTK